MSFNLTDLLLIGITYLTFLFGAAYITERGWISSRIVYHPVTYVLSLGVYASVWTFYGTFVQAQTSGYSFLASYIGASATFFLAPVVLVPILRITRTYQLSSLADLFAFRFRSGAVGTLTALLTVIATLPLISIQIQAVADSLHILNSDFTSNQIALGFCSVITLFSILFGARHPSLRQSHAGLIIAMATSSLIKLFALGAIALYAFYGVLQGPEGLNIWLDQTPEALNALYTPLHSDAWKTLLLGFFAAVIVMPHTFHMLFTENTSANSLYKASWGMPLYLLLLALAVPPILWAGVKLGLAEQPEFLILHLGIGLRSDFLTVLAFIGGLSAASGIIIVATISMASMLQNHLVLSLVPLPSSQRFYAWLLWLRRLLIVTLMLGSYLFYTQVGSRHDLYLLGIITFIAFMQFLPGILATLFWPTAHRIGFILGVSCGMTIWMITMLIPLFNTPDGSFYFSQSGSPPWHHAAIYSLAANITVFVLTSLLMRATPAEIQSAQACLYNAQPQPLTPPLNVQNSRELINHLSQRLGSEAAQREVTSVLHELALNEEELTPLDLMRLRSLLEIRLSALMGPVEAAAVLGPIDHHQTADSFRTRDIHLLESQLENYQARLTGLAAELDSLRRHHRMTLQKLPIGACSLDANGLVIFWNAEMEQFTGLTSRQVLSKRMESLPPPWGELLANFCKEERAHLLSHHLTLRGENCWISLHKANLMEDSESEAMVILLEDETDNQLLVNKLSHSERLASIGRFAAGVAHEIGNPVTGIACLSQNLKYETDNPFIQETAEQVLAQTQRITRIVQSLIRFAHTGQHDLQQSQESINLHELVGEAIHLVSLDIRGKQQQLHNQVPAELIICGDLQHLLQVFVNLLNNACDASAIQTNVWITAETTDNSVVIHITDEGSGIPPEHQQKIFEPFFTTKDPDKGTGLGLPLVYNIIEEHYGSINIVSPANKKQNKGTRVVITLPRSPQDTH